MSPSRQSISNSSVGRDQVRILVADDEPTIADTLRMILATEGLDAIAVYNGKEAIDKARDWKPCIFLSDVIMPEINGIEVKYLRFFLSVKFCCFQDELLSRICCRKRVKKGTISLSCQSRFIPLT